MSKIFRRLEESGHPWVEIQIDGTSISAQEGESVASMVKRIFRLNLLIYDVLDKKRITKSVMKTRAGSQIVFFTVDLYFCNGHF